MDIDPSDTMWNSYDELLRWRRFYVPLLSGISLVFCIMAQFLYFKFPRLLKFPRCIPSWLNCYNFYFSLFLFLKWLPITPWHERWINGMRAGGPACIVDLWMVFTQISGPVACNTLLCLTIYLVTVWRMDIEDNRIFFWSYIAFAFVYPFVTAFALTFVLNEQYKGLIFAVCAPKVTPYRFPTIIFWLAQIILISISTKHLFRVIKSVNNSNEFPIRYVVIRFLATLISQLYTMWPSLLSDTILLNGSDAIWQRFVSVSRASGPILDAIVMILGNHDFIQWAKKRYFRKFQRSMVDEEISTKLHAKERVDHVAVASSPFNEITNAISENTISENAMEMSEFESTKVLDINVEAEGK